MIDVLFSCARHGVTHFPDPTIGSNGLPTLTINAGNVTPVTGAPGGSTGLQEAPAQPRAANARRKTTANAAALKYATCMRSNGVPDFPDPNGQGLIQINNATGSLDASSPQFQKAETACNSLDNGFAEQLGATQASPESGSAQTST